MVFGREKQRNCSLSRGILLLAVWAVYALSMTARGAELPSFPAPTREQAADWYEAARSEFQKNARDGTAAWKLAEACFEWAEYASNSSQRASLADEGIAAAKLAVNRLPDHPAPHFYLAMNKGQLARTKTLGALPLVREMERSFRRAIELDAKFDHAAADRSLGMLYLDAPGWPTSIGSRSKARKHLERAVELAAGYPTNHLTLMEAYLRWKDEDALHRAMQRYRKLLPVARETYAGARWENSWKNWDREWTNILEKSRELFE
jgi:tetratricopeptide (TPR) repeat protein